MFTALVSKINYGQVTDWLTDWLSEWVTNWQSDRLLLEAVDSFMIWARDADHVGRPPAGYVTSFAFI